MRKVSSFYFGVSIIIIGTIFLLSDLNIFTIPWGSFWVVFVWILGLAFELGFFLSKNKNPGLLVPGGIILTIAFIFSVCTTFGWHKMAELWPLFILAPAVGLLQLYIFGVRKTGLLIPVGILTAVGGTFLISNIASTYKFFVPIALIFTGILLILPRNKN